MINLLATDRKAELSAARTNIIILRYIGILLLAFAFIFGVFYTSYSVLERTMVSSTQLIESNDVKAEVYSETQEQVNALSTQLNEARNILNNEVRFSQVLVQIGQAMPEGIIIGDVTLTNEAFTGKPIEIKAYAKSSNEASQLPSQLLSSPIFSSVTLQGTESSGGVSGYPVVVTVTAVLSKGGM